MAEEISINEAREVLKVSRPTIYRLIRLGRLHPIKKLIGVGPGGTHVYFDRTEVEALKGATVRVPLDQGLGDAGLTRRPPPVAKRKRSKRAGKK
jgi:excisionase family DNA binding protein